MTAITPQSRLTLLRVVHASEILAATASTSEIVDSRCSRAAQRSVGRDQGAARRRTARRSREVKAVEVHHFVPRGHEVAHEFFLPGGAGVDLGNGAQLRVVAEDEID